ncbi:hypothetical protein Pfo_000670 [Paulownia fortunei]|nr:hypothetical protein Pfo_000670 [Paulownia fortunei]
MNLVARNIDFLSVEDIVFMKDEYKFIDGEDFCFVHLVEIPTESWICRRRMSMYSCSLVLSGIHGFICKILVPQVLFLPFWNFYCNFLLHLVHKITKENPKYEFAGLIFLLSLVI